jgi:two-component system, OmpR family, sensor histidine kinase CpxA
MRSVFARILLWCFCTLVLASFGFSVVTSRAYRNGVGMAGRLNEIDDSSFKLSLAAYQAGGSERLKEVLQHISSVLAANVTLVDSRGVDLATGVAVPHGYLEGTYPVPQERHGRRVFARPYMNGQYYLLMLISDTDNDDVNYVPFYIILAGTSAVLCWVLAVNIAKPVRRLTEAVERFGAGDLNARANSVRRDEIGELSRAFDRMADRVATLMSAERRLLQDISHELRSPLSRLTFAAELVGSAKNPEAAAARVKKEVRRLADLVSALVEVTRAEGDPEARALDAIDLESLLSEVVVDCSVDAESHGCTVALKTSPSRLLGDRELLRRAVENIIRNAVHYAPEGTQVEVRCDVAAGLARVWVRDFGPGVPQDDLGRIFQPFYRVDGSREAATGGMGLGLAIAARAIALHHGNVWARNANPGLIIWIELPISPG